MFFLEAFFILIKSKFNLPHLNFICELKQIKNYIEGGKTMTNQQDTNQLQRIALRIREMRQILGYTTAKMAEMTDLSEETYISYESGTVDLPFTFMHKCSQVYGIELTDILEGTTQQLLLTFLFPCYVLLRAMAKS